MPIRTLCQCCSAVLVDAPPLPDGRVSHGIGRCCWDSFRAKCGLAPAPFPMPLQRAS